MQMAPICMYTQWLANLHMKYKVHVQSVHYNTHSDVLSLQRHYSTSPGKLMHWWCVNPGLPVGVAEYPPDVHLPDGSIHDGDLHFGSSQTNQDKYSTRLRGLWWCDSVRVWGSTCVCICLWKKLCSHIDSSSYAGLHSWTLNGMSRLTAQCWADLFSYSSAISTGHLHSVSSPQLLGNLQTTFINVWTKGIRISVKCL